MLPRRLLSATVGPVRRLAWSTQRTLIYPAPLRARAPTARGGHLVRIGTADREAHALHLPAPDGAPTVVHFHGNAETLADVAPLAEILADAGLGVYAVEYPGYGVSPGRPSERAFYETAEQALRHLREELGVSPTRTVLQGQSLGTGVATEMSVRGHGARLVLISPFTSMTSMVRRFAPMLPRPLLVEDRFDTLEKAPRVTAPTLVIHGSRDPLVPAFMGEAVARAVPDSELLLSPDAHHNDLFSIDGPRLLRRMIAFVRGAA